LDNLVKVCAPASLASCEPATVAVTDHFDFVAVTRTCWYCGERAQIGRLDDKQCLESQGRAHVASGRPSRSETPTIFMGSVFCQRSLLIEPRPSLHRKADSRPARETFGRIADLAERNRQLLRTVPEVSAVESSELSAGKISPTVSCS
jgi:hypothetical protein